METVLIVLFSIGAVIGLAAIAALKLHLDDQKTRCPECGCRLERKRKPYATGERLIYDVSCSNCGYEGEQVESRPQDL